jgi:tetraacyldisaccharide 4'-kinase
MMSLNPFAPLLAGLVKGRNWLYDKAFINATRVPVPVISVGNVTMGGTGKTPFIAFLLRELVSMGVRPGVVSRSYRARASDSEWVNLTSGAHSIFGDEALLLKSRYPEVPMMAGPSKWQSAIRMAAEDPSVEVILVDDGFQHRRLHRDLNVVLLDVSVSPTDYEWPPIGRARESLQSLKRADVVVLTRWEQRCEDTVAFIQKWLPSDVLKLRAEQTSGSLRHVGGNSLKRSDLKPLRAFAFCGLGNPESFRKTLMSEDLNIDFFRPLSDHQPYNSALIQEIIEQGHQADYFITSEKDAVKLSDWPFNGPPLYVIPIELNLSGSVEEFREKLTQILRKKS